MDKTPVNKVTICVEYIDGSTETLTTGAAEGVALTVNRGTRTGSDAWVEELILNIYDLKADPERVLYRVRKASVSTATDPPREVPNG